MKTYQFFSILSFTSIAFADVTYNVVGYPDSITESFGVLIEGKVTRLSTSNVTFPLWSTMIPMTTTSSSYKFVKLSDNGTIIHEESFLRAFQSSIPNSRSDNNDNKGVASTTTPNEFFERQMTWSQLPNVPQVYEDVRPRASAAFDETQIATIHVNTDPVKFSAMVADPWGHTEPISADFRFINSHLVHNVMGISMKISGKSSRNFRKQSFTFIFDSMKNQAFFERPSIKLCAEGYDPTMIREKLYIDILNSIGVRTQQSAWTRLYVNNKPYGFYLMVDEIDVSFLRETMHHGDSQPSTLGSFYQMASPKIDIQADLQYIGSSPADYPEEVYTNINLGSNPPDAPMTQLLRFMKDLEDYDSREPNGTVYWKNRLDLEGFLRNMALEFLGGSWDGYWWVGSNYFLYFNPTLADSTSVDEGKWQWIPTDFDSTFGNGRPTDVQTTYQEYAPRLVKHDHPLVTKLILENNDINTRFEQMLLEIVRGVFNPAAIFPRIDMYEKMIAMDVEWDRSIDRSQVEGKDLQYTIKDFHDSIVTEVTGVNIGIKPWIEQRAKNIPNQVLTPLQDGSARNIDVSM
ncbi:hypothetical protein BGX27_010406, partial [Mortierella sp. AM989]